MAKRLAIPSKELQLFIVGPRDSFKASRVQRLTLNTDIPSTTVDELGNPAHVGDVKDVPNVTLTFSAMDVGIKVFAALTGTNPDAYPAAGVDISSLKEMDAVLYVKDPDLSEYVKSAHARRLQIRDFTYNFSSDGEATEDYTAVGSEKRWFSNDIQVDKFTTGTTSFTLTQTPVQLKNGRLALSVTVDGDYLTEVTGAPAAGEYRIVGTTLTTGDSMVNQAFAVYQTAAASPNWASVSDTASAKAIKGKDVGVKIAANSIPRITSLTINGTLNVQPVRELGNRAIVGYQKQVPEVTGTITVLDTDNELISLLQYGVLASGTEYAPGEGCTAADVALEISLYDPCDDTAPISVLKTYYLDKIVVTSDSYSGTVNQNTTVTYNFKSTTGTVYVYSGAR